MGNPERSTDQSVEYDTPPQSPGHSAVNGIRKESPEHGAVQSSQEGSTEHSTVCSSGEVPENSAVSTGPNMSPDHTDPDGGPKRSRNNTDTDDTSLSSSGHDKYPGQVPASEPIAPDDVTYFTRYCDQMTDFHEESESWRMYIVYNNSKLGHIPEIYGTEAFQNYRSAESLYSERTGTKLPMVMSPNRSQCTLTADPDRRLENY